MELWIRSQDKKILLKATIIKWENGCLRGATDEDCWYHDLGKYKKERALEVLDEIQYLLNNNFCYSKELGQYITCNNAIYEMPKD